MRGVAFVVAVTLVAEVGDFSRFANPRQSMAYLGLVPSEHSSGRAVHRAESPMPEMLWRDELGEGVGLLEKGVGMHPA
jgi:transposase